MFRNYFKLEIKRLIKRFAGIDTDKYKYPIGSGRVTFNNVRSYVRAISAAYVEIHTDKFTKKVPPIYLLMGSYFSYLLYFYIYQQMSLNKYNNCSKKTLIHV